MMGICRSKTAITKGSPSSFAAVSIRSADDPFSASDGRMPQDANRRFRISRLVALSSTTRTRTPFRLARAGISFGLFIELSDWIFNLTVNQKSDPLPTTLSTPTVPPINSASCFEMANPRPVPPNLRVVEASTWLNLLKSKPIFSAGMPMPVSRIENFNSTSLSDSARQETRTATSP